MNRNTYINPKVILGAISHTAKHSRETDPQAIHVNPHFPRAQTVYLNPRFVNNTNILTGPGSSNLQNEKSSKPHQLSIYSCQGGQNDLQAINNDQLQLSSHKKPIYAKDPPAYLSPSGKKLIRKSLKSGKPKVLLQESSHKFVANEKHFQGQFKLDKRPLHQRRCSTHKNSIVVTKSRYKTERLFAKNVYTLNNCRTVKACQPKNTKPNHKQRVASTNKKLVNIGGILYRATNNKLMRAVKATTSTISGVISATKAHKGKKLVNKHVISIRGESFVLSKNGATLRRLPESSKTISVVRPRQRIDFGGVTYKQATGDVLVRTNSHKTRTVLTQARQRSIACLTTRRRKINIPCTVFRKLGRCRRFESGMCAFTHDRKNVDLCKSFLQGECLGKSCLLSHDVVHQKVATCRFFLEGSCGRDKCPYLHVKVSGKADICPPFLQGYCELGDQCSQRHVNVCPEFEKTGSCRKGVKCPYPHKRPGQKTKLEQSKSKFKCRSTRSKRKELATSSPKLCKEKKRKLYSALESEGSADKDDRVRYYAEPVPGPSNDSIDIVPNRQRLDSLPSFIAFEPS